MVLLTQVIDMAIARRDAVGAIAVGVAYPLVGGINDDVLRSELLRIANRLLDLPV